MTLRNDDDGGSQPPNHLCVLSTSHKVTKNTTIDNETAAELVDGVDSYSRTAWATDSTTYTIGSSSYITATQTSCGRTIESQRD
jgi:hypothetical protein